MLLLYCKSAELLQRIIAKKNHAGISTYTQVIVSFSLVKQPTFRGGNRSFRPSYLSPYFRVI